MNGAVGGCMVSRALVQRSREKVGEIGELRARVSSLEASLSVSNVTFGAMIVRGLGRRDGFTHRHAADLAREVGMDEARVGRLRLADLLHNVGLLGLSEDLLLATDKPNSIAQSRLAEHPARSEEALAAVPGFGEMASWVRWHHERPDGRGTRTSCAGPGSPRRQRSLPWCRLTRAWCWTGPAAPALAPRKPGRGLAPTPSSTAWWSGPSCASSTQSLRATAWPTTTASSSPRSGKCRRSPPSRDAKATPPGGLHKSAPKVR